MKKYIIIFILLFVSIFTKAQEPTGFPTQFNNGWQQWGYQQSIKGTIIATRDTNWIPRYCGTMILWPHAGVDTAYWMWNCVRWKKISSSGDVASPIWGNITGTLSNQTDLQNALNLKFNIVDTANKWVQNVYSRGDSLFKFKNGSESFIGVLNAVSSSIFASNGLVKDADTVKWGQSVNAVGNPAALSRNTEVPMNGFNSVFTGTGGIGIGTSTVGNRKLNISATSTTQGVNITTVDGIGINVVTSGNGHALFAQTAGTGNALTGSNAGSSGYGVLAVNSNNNVVPLKSNVFSTLTNSSSPVATEFTRNVFGIPADGVGLTVMFRGQTTVSTDVESGQIRNYWSTVLHSGRSSAFEFHLVNNTVSGRKALLASTGQWTWDGYPGLTAQADTATYKPIGIDGSGNVVKMAGWAGSGGGGASLTATQVAFGSGTNTITSDAAFNYLAASNKLNVDSIRVIQSNQDSSLFVRQSPYLPADSVLTDGNSITVGLNASPTTLGYAYLFAASQGLTISNIAVSGTGMVSITNRHLVNKNPGNTVMSTVMGGLNDVRRNGVARKTLNKIINGYKSIFANQYLSAFTNAGTGGVGVTRYGSWTSNWNAQAEGGKATVAAYTSTTNDSIVYVFTDSTVIVGLMGGDGSASSYIGTDVDVYIDGVLVTTINTNDQTDGVADGSGLDNKRCAMAFYFGGLTNAAHEIKLVKKSTGGGGFLICDYFGHFVSRPVAYAMLWFHAPYLTGVGYATSPSNANNAAIDSVNNKIDSLVNTDFISWYPTWVVETNNCYDTTTGTSGDGIHPNNVGHAQINTCAVNRINQVNGGGGSTGKMYYSNEFRGVVEGIDDAFLMLKRADLRYVQNQDNITQSARFKIDGEGTLSRITTDGSISGASLSVADRQRAGFISGLNGPLPFFGIRNNANATDAKSYDWFLGSSGIQFRILSDDMMTSTDYLRMVRSGMTIDTLQMPKLDISGTLKVYTHAIASNSDSAVVWDRATNAYKIAAINAAGVTTLYTGDGTLPATRSVSGAGNSLNLGLIGSQLGLFSIYSNSRTVLNSGITYGTDATNTDANYTVPANKIIAELTDVPLSTGRTLTLPTAATNGQTVTLVMRYSAGSNKYSLSSAVTDNATGTTFTQLDWGVTYDFMVDQALAWRLIRKY